MILKSSNFKTFTSKIASSSAKIIEFFKGWQLDKTAKIEGLISDGNVVCLFLAANIGRRVTLKFFSNSTQIFLFVYRDRS